MTAAEEIAFLKAQNASQAQEIRFLEQKVLSLESKVLQLPELSAQQGIKKDSHNSAKPPSSDLSAVQAYN
jgi:hypothetical protein